MSRKELIDAIAKDTCLSKREVEAVFDATFDQIGKALVAGEGIRIMGFGAFSVKVRKAHTGRNPKTKETIEIPARKVPIFTASPTLKEACDN